MSGDESSEQELIRKARAGDQDAFAELVAIHAERVYGALRRFGLDPGRMLDILNVSTGRNFSTEVVMKEHVVGERFATGFALGLLAKDVRIAAQLARTLHQDAPLAELMDARWALALERLGAGVDHSRAILGWDQTVDAR